jgi:hypothetical protein
MLRAITLEFEFHSSSYGYLLLTIGEAGVSSTRAVRNVSRREMQMQMQNAFKIMDEKHFPSLMETFRSPF